ncbi:MAG: FAD-dependent oxidoreductase [Bacillota bacterium]
MVDLFVIGGGAAGYAGALRAAQLGGKVLLVEMEKLGGICLHRGCVPSKVLYQQAAVIESYRAALRSGLFEDEPVPKLAAVARRQDEVVEKLYLGLQDLFKKRGITIMHGRALIRGPGRVLVHGEGRVEEYFAGSILVAAGSQEKNLSIPGAEELSGAEVSLKPPEEPCRIAVIGGGITGLELAGAYASLGFKMTVVEREKVLLPALQDEEISKWLAFFLKRRGIKIFTGTGLERIERSVENGIEVLKPVLSPAGKQHVITVDRVINAAGRKPRLDVFAPNVDGVKQHAGGIAVNERMETSIKGIYAAGDVTGLPMLAHLAYFEGMVAAENAMGINRILDLKAVPSCLSAKPGLAWVGLTEKQAIEAGITPQVVYFPFAANAGAALRGGEEGFVKIIAAEDGIILGMQVLGEYAEELIMEGTVAVRHGLSIQQLSRTMHPHPTVHEAVWEACLSLEGFPLHG